MMLWRLLFLLAGAVSQRIHRANATKSSCAGRGCGRAAVALVGGFMAIVTCPFCGGDPSPVDCSNDARSPSPVDCSNDARSPSPVDCSNDAAIALALSQRWA